MNPFNLRTGQTALTVCLLAKGRAARKPMLLLEFVRGLFKFNADTPALDVLLKFAPRNATREF